MGKKNPSFRNGLIAGLLMGVLIGGASLAHSGMGRKAWMGSSDSGIQGGYVLGFTDAVRLSKQMNPGGYLDRNYKLPKGVPWYAWTAAIDDLYENPGFENGDVPLLMARVSRELAKKYGVEPSRDPDQGLADFKSAVERTRESGKAKATESESGSDSEGVAPGEESREESDDSVERGPDEH